MRFAEAFQSRLGDSLGKTKKPRLHILRKSSNFGCNGFIQDFDLPSHVRLYLNFEIG